MVIELNPSHLVDIHTYCTRLAQTCSARGTPPTNTKAFINECIQRLPNEESDIYQLSEKSVYRWVIGDSRGSLVNKIPLLVRPRPGETLLTMLKSGFSTRNVLFYGKGLHGEEAMKAALDQHAARYCREFDGPGDDGSYVVIENIEAAADDPVPVDLPEGLDDEETTGVPAGVLLKTSHDIGSNWAPVADAPSNAQEGVGTGFAFVIGVIILYLSRGAVPQFQPQGALPSLTPSLTPSFSRNNEA